ncbi:hypothetical protein J2Z84_003837 [Agrobacterium rubi]|nr:hypothetical protein [Agrobacterium rubi]
MQTAGHYTHEPKYPFLRISDQRFVYFIRNVYATWKCVAIRAGFCMDLPKFLTKLPFAIHFE